MINKIAQIKVGEFQGLGPLGTDKFKDPASTLNEIVTNAITLISLIAAIWFLFVLITGAVAWIGSGGDKGALESARKRMVNGIVGILIIVAALFIADILGNIVGLEILNPGEILNQIMP